MGVPGTADDGRQAGGVSRASVTCSCTYTVICRHTLDVRRLGGRNFKGLFRAPPSGRKLLQGAGKVTFAREWVNLNVFVTVGEGGAAAQGLRATQPAAETPKEETWGVTALTLLLPLRYVMVCVLSGA